MGSNPARVACEVFSTDTRKAPSIQCYTQRRCRAKLNQDVDKIVTFITCFLICCRLFRSISCMYGMYKNYMENNCILSQSRLSFWVVFDTLSVQR